MKLTELELGGSSPFVVLHDAYLELLVDAALFGARVRELPYGDPNRPDTSAGPIINRSQLERLRKPIAKAE